MQHIIRAGRIAGLLLIAAGSVCQPAGAAPFCFRNQVVPPQCIYYDAHECQMEANRQNGECSANPSELQLTRGMGQYCVVISGGAANCSYTDASTCSRDAARQNGACAPATRLQPAGTPDPYSTVNGN
jgi:hypothetical protein